MKKNNLVPNKGLSLSQAQSISNLCNQRAIEIANQLLPINNYSKSVVVNGKTHEIVKGVKMPEKVIDLLKEKASLHACQAFLMENLKAKEAMLQAAKKVTADISSVTIPERPAYVNAVILPEVQESWGWEQLTAAELNKYLEAEAFASHIGQFIHKDSILARLRAELPNIPAIEWMVIKDGEKTPVSINVHHKSQELLTTHEDLAAVHREYEQIVNYFKAKVKNLTTEENARIAKINADAQADVAKTNADLQTAYDSAMRTASEAIRGLKADFEKTRQADVKKIASMRIDVDQRFQGVVDTFLKQLSTEE